MPHGANIDLRYIVFGYIVQNILGAEIYNTYCVCRWPTVSKPHDLLFMIDQLAKLGDNHKLYYSHSSPW